MHLCPLIAVCKWTDSNEKEKKDFCVHLNRFSQMKNKNFEQTVNWELELRTENYLFNVHANSKQRIQMHF